MFCRTHQRLVAGLVVALALTAAACGGDDDNASSTTDTTAAPTTTSGGMIDTTQAMSDAPFGRRSCQRSRPRTSATR